MNYHNAELAKSLPILLEPSPDKAIDEAIGRLKKILDCTPEKICISSSFAFDLLSETESLRRFALTKRTLGGKLRERNRFTGTSVGQQLAQAIYALVESLPAKLNGKAADQMRFDRQTRRAIGCLGFLISVDTAYL